VEHSYNEGIGGSGSHFNYINPDFYKLIPWEGKGYKPAGYGFDSVSASLTAAYAMNKAIRDLPADVALQRKQEMIREIDGKGIIATPANSCINELVVEAARLSILNNGKNVSIAYGANPCAIMEK
jgi:D-galacturonate reductase